MKKLSKIVLATEFSKTCEAARAHAVLLAQQSGAELHVVFVQVLHGDQYGWAGIPNVAQVEKAMSDASDSRMAQFVDKIDVPLATAVERDISAGSAILRYSEQLDADLIVVGTHARRGLSRMFLGSVASEVMRHSSLPVLGIGPDQEPSGAGEYGKLLLPVDFSEASASTVLQGQMIANSDTSYMTLLHVVDDRPLPPYFKAAFEESARENARVALKQFADDFKGGESMQQRVTVGIPADSIAECAFDMEADLIVMGNSGLGAIDRFFLGSTADRLLRRMPCPVLIQRGEPFQVH